MSARMIAELAGRDGDAGLAAAVDRVDRRGLGRRADGDAEVDVAQVAGGPGELELGASRRADVLVAWRNSAQVA